MRILKSIKRLGMLLLLCISCVAIMTIVTLRNKGESEEEIGIPLSEESKAKVMQTLDTVEAGADDLIDQAQQVYEKYGTEFVEEANDAINGAVKNAAKDAVQSFFENIIPKTDE